MSLQINSQPWRMRCDVSQKGSIMSKGCSYDANPSSIFLLFYPSLFRTAISGGVHSGLRKVFGSVLSGWVVHQLVFNLFFLFSGGWHPSGRERGLHGWIGEGVFANLIQVGAQFTNSLFSRGVA